MKTALSFDARHPAPLRMIGIDSGGSEQEYDFSPKNPAHIIQRSGTLPLKMSPVHNGMCDLGLFPSSSKNFWNAWDERRKPVNDIRLVGNY